MVTMKMLAGLLLLAVMPLASAAEATDYANVSALQPPVWVEQNGSRTALPASAAISDRGRYITGPGARLQIALADGSLVKLGENAEFELPSLQLKQSGHDSILQGTLKVIKGAFRYTTQALSFIHQRELDVAVGPTITIGIRGTDIWGKSDNAQDLACLLEGKVRIASPGRPETALDQSGTFYVVPRGEAPMPVAQVAPETLQTWIPQTELAADRAALQSNGPYSVVLAVYLDEALAGRRLREFDQNGYPVRLLRQQRSGVTVFSLIVDGFSSAQSGAAFAAESKRAFPLLRHPHLLPPDT